MRSTTRRVESRTVTPTNMDRSRCATLVWTGALLALSSGEALAFDSYRYLHVTIETPWAIFLILLPVVMSPFILMAFLYWRFANRRTQQEKQAKSPESDKPTNG